MMRARSFNVNVMELNEVGDIADLGNKGHIMLMCSTAGEGDMPSTAESFWEFINDPTIDVAEQPLRNVKLSSLCGCVWMWTVEKFYQKNSLLSG